MQGSAPQGKRHLLPHHSTFGTEYHNYAYYLARIIDSIQRFYGRDRYDEEQIATEIATATEDHIHLHFLRQSTTSAVMLPYVAGRRGFPVCWGKEIYGSLQIKFIEDGRDQHILPVSLCERLALDCGWSLHVLEREREHQWQQHKDRSEAARKVAALSPAQCKVLELMVKGESTRVIAEKLHLSKRTIETHQRNIYQLLEVHSQREAILIGLTAGLGHGHFYEDEEQEAG